MFKKILLYGLPILLLSQNNYEFSPQKFFNDIGELIHPKLKNMNLDKRLFSSERGGNKTYKEASNDGLGYIILGMNNGKTNNSPIKDIKNNSQLENKILEKYKDKNTVDIKITDNTLTQDEKDILDELKNKKLLSNENNEPEPNLSISLVGNPVLNGGTTYFGDKSYFTVLVNVNNNELLDNNIPITYSAHTDIPNITILDSAKLLEKYNMTVPDSLFYVLFYSDISTTINQSYPVPPAGHIPITFSLLNGVNSGISIFNVNNMGIITSDPKDLYHNLNIESITEGSTAEFNNNGTIEHLTGKYGVWTNQDESFFQVEHKTRKGAWHFIDFFNTLHMNVNFHSFNSKYTNVSAFGQYSQIPYLARYHEQFNDNNGNIYEVIMDTGNNSYEIKYIEDKGSAIDIVNIFSSICPNYDYNVNSSFQLKCLQTILNCPIGFVETGSDECTGLTPYNMN